MIPDPQGSERAGKRRFGIHAGLLILGVVAVLLVSMIGKYW
jgi:hypothetical protein